MFRAYSLRLKPTAKQRASLDNILTVSCDLYNAALQERRDAWTVSRKNVSYHDQTRELTELRHDDPAIALIAVRIAREPLRRVDRAFKAFFRRCKSGKKPGYPRFRTKARYSSFAYPEARIKSDRLRIPNIGSLRFKSHRAIDGTPKSVIIKCRRNRWTARVLCDIGPAPKKITVATATGIDVGLSAFATLSDGTIIENPRWTKRFEQRITCTSQSLSRKERGSNNRIRAKVRLSRTYERSVNARRDFCHHVSKWLVDNFDLIAFEKLNIKGMVRSNLAKSILDAAWGELVWQIIYKAESAGKWAVPVNPRGTTIDCSGCREPVPKTLADRTHSCRKCGLVLNRDHNAAKNILRLGESLAGLVPSEQILGVPSI